MTDTERMDWLDRQGTVSVRHIRDSETGCAEGIAYRQGMRVEIFTVVTQHMYGTDLREVIDAANGIPRAD